MSIEEIYIIVSVAVFVFGFVMLITALAKLLSGNKLRAKELMKIFIIATLLGILILGGGYLYDNYSKSNDAQKNYLRFIELSQEKSLSQEDTEEAIILGDNFKDGFESIEEVKTLLSKFKKLKTDFYSKPTVYTYSETTNIRSKPKGEIINGASKYIPFALIEKKNGWTKIAYKSYKDTFGIDYGWIKSSLLITEEGNKARKKLNSGDLELKSWGWKKSYNNLIAEGLIINRSDYKLNNVIAVFIGMDSKGNFISSNTAYIDYNPLLAGQSSPFKVYLDYNPSISKSKVEFKNYEGQKIKYFKREKFNPSGYRP